MSIYRRLVRASRKYLVAEVVGTLLAMSGAWLAYHLTASHLAAGWAGSICEGVGFYGVVLVAESRHAGRLTENSPRTLIRISTSLLARFGPAEVLDSLVIRPLLMSAGPQLAGSVITGTVIGKLAADVAFYLVVAASAYLRRGFIQGHVMPKARSDASAAVPPAARTTVSTPYLEMSLDQVELAYHALHAALPEAVVHFAMKCNPDRPILRRLHTLGARFEIASLAELSELIAIGVDPRHVLFSNPVKIPEHVRGAAEVGVYRFAADSDAELDKIAAMAPGASVYIRLSTPPANSAVPSEGKFGVEPDDAVRLLRGAVRRGLAPYGLTFHVGSQATNATVWQEAIERSAAVMKQLLAENIRITMLDLGGGFPARYEGSDHPGLDLYAARIRAAVQQCIPYAVDLVVEPGRALVAEAGVMVATVIGIADRAGHRWAHLDVGAFNGMMEALETANQLRYPVTDSRNSAVRLQYHLTGPTCDSQDTLLYNVHLSADLAVGDQVRIGVAGAYTTQYASRFNGFDIPAIHYRAGKHRGDVKEIAALALPAQSVMAPSKG